MKYLNEISNQDILQTPPIHVPVQAGLLNIKGRHTSNKHFDHALIVVYFILDHIEIHTRKIRSNMIRD